MKKSYTLKEFPRSRIATFDTFSVGMLKHHVSALLEILVDHDVIDGGQMVRFLKELTRQIENGEELSLTKP